MEYRVVKTINEELIFNSPIYQLGTNNMGEFLALVKGIQIVKESGQFDRVIFADSQTALSWVRKKKSNSTLVRNAETEVLYQELEKAENWLKNINLDDFRIVKWETHIHGEIKADYGRKR
jgi:ribonuclease HI